MTAPPRAGPGRERVRPGRGGLRPPGNRYGADEAGGRAAAGAVADVMVIAAAAAAAATIVATAVMVVVRVSLTGSSPRGLWSLLVMITKSSRMLAQCVNSSAAARRPGVPQRTVSSFSAGLAQIDWTPPACALCAWFASVLLAQLRREWLACPRACHREPQGI